VIVRELNQDRDQESLGEDEVALRVTASRGNLNGL
jgi:hypothetical protein